jgi:hypothetical protein
MDTLHKGDNGDDDDDDDNNNNNNNNARVELKLYIYSLPQVSLLIRIVAPDDNRFRNHSVCTKQRFTKQSICTDVSIATAALIIAIKNLCVQLSLRKFQLHCLHIHVKNLTPPYHSRVVI